MRRTISLHFLAFLTFLVPGAARAELMIPVVVRVTGLTQVADVDSIPPNLGDLFAEVTIDGQGFSNIGDQCENAGTAGYVLPFPFFSEPGSLSGIADSSCSNVPWTFEANVPLSAFQGDDPTQPPPTIPIRIKIVDEDTFDNDDVQTIDLDVAFGGRWSGDATWPTNCVNGGGAGVCWRIDVGQDADGDGLLDDWETNGLDADGDGDVDLDLPALGADPLHKDLFVELDWRQGFPPKRAEVQLWREAFLAAPIDAGGVPNPDGLPGIDLHVDTGALNEGGQLVGENLGGGNELAANFPVCSLDGIDFGLYAAKPTNFDAATRELVFRYGIVSTRCCLFGPDVGNPCTVDAECTSAVCQPSGGEGEIGGNDFVVWNYDLFQGSTLMHELGHNLDLRHGGLNSDNCKPNYLSIMNYDHFELQRLDGSTFLDYSPPRQTTGARGTAPLPSLAEDDLDEGAVLDPADPETLLTYTDLARTKRQSPVGAPVNWNGDGDATDSGIPVNIDTSSLAGFPALCTNTVLRSALPDPPGPLSGHDDWRNVSLPFLQFGNAADGPVNPVPDPEPNEQEILLQLQEANTTDLSVAKSGDPGPYEAGLDLTLAYVVDAANQGPNPALPLLVHDTLPAGATLLSADPTCLAITPGELTCRFDGVLAGQTRAVPLSLQVRASCAGGIPTQIVNQASVANGATRAGADPDPSNDSASFTTAVVDTTPPELTLSASPSTLWPPNHKFVAIAVSVTTSDVCDDTPEVRLVSITSNEGTLANGSGHTSPDVEGAAFGSDDRALLLRAERRGPGGGRVYTITYEAEDGSGNVTTRTVAVTVAKSQGAP